MPRNQNESKVGLFLVLCLGLSVILACKLSNVLNHKSMFEGTTMQDAATAFKGKIGGPFKALSVEIEKDSVELKAQDPKNPAHVDLYKYSPVLGAVTGPTPVQLSLLENKLDTTLFDFDSVNWGATTTLARRAVERTQLEGGAVSKMTIERGLSIANDMTKSGKLSWTVAVRGARESATAYADIQGKIVGLDLSQTARAANFKMITTDALHEAVKQINEVFGTSPRLLELVIRDKGLSFKAQDPQSKELKQYDYGINGVTINTLTSQFGMSTPFILHDHKLEEVLFGFDDFKIDQAPDLARKALERMGSDNTRTASITIKKEQVSVFSPKLVLQWDVTLQRTGKFAMVVYDVSGNEVRTSTW